MKVDGNKKVGEWVDLWETDGKTLKSVWLQLFGG